MKCSHVLAASAVLVLAAALPSLEAEEAELPNIVLMMGDDHGWEETGYNGHPYLHTPVLDEMAATGLRLDRFYAAHPSCSPTRGSFLTGRHPNRYGTFAPGWSLRPEEITVAQVLGEAGYRCGHFGKWHVGAVKAESPVSPGAMGFHEWLAHDNFFEMDPYLSRNGGPPQRFEGEGSEVIIAETLRFINRAQQEKKPFFAIVWFGSPHEPYSGLPADLALYDALPKKYADRTVRLTSNETGLQVERPLGEVLRERYAEITAMDRAIGILRKHLAKEGLRENTLVFYCGDNGTSTCGLLCSPHRGAKGQIYEGGVRVPGVMEWPARIPKPRASSVNAVTSDLLPTLCAIAGRPLPDRPLDGVDLTPLIDGQMTERPTPIFFWSYNTRRFAGMDLEPWMDPSLQEGTTPLVKLSGGIATRNFQNLRHPAITEADFLGPRAVVDNRFKLVLHDRKDGPPKVELFDLRDDPGETRELATQRPDVLQTMSRQMRDWQTSVLMSLTGNDYHE
ncbi:MAG: sulfatase-like hydrolase/transferase [Patescibacteria group bacterium]|nr:sulfatase-like hydrolase/transferase [Patescibacteria group bacterium]